MEEKPIPVGNMHEGLTCMSTCHAKTSEHGNEVTGAKIMARNAASPNLLHFHAKLHITLKYGLNLKCLWNEVLSNVFLLHCKDHLKWQCNLFGRIFVTPFLLEIFNFIRYANNTTCDIMVHNNFLKIIINLESDEHTSNLNAEAK